MAQVGTIWVLFGDLSGLKDDEDRLRGLYMERRNEVNKINRLSLGLPTGSTSKKALLTHLADPGTVAIAWHSHGVSRENFGPTGEVMCGGGSRLAPGEIKKVSPNLQYAAFIGCSVRANSAIESEWIRALKFNRFPDAKRRFTAAGGNITLWERTDATGRKVWGFGREFASGSASRLQPYKFSDWIERLHG